MLKNPEHDTHEAAANFDHKDVEILTHKTVYQGFFKMEKLQLKHRLFAGGWSRVCERELFVRGSAAAAVIYDPVNDLIGLIEQFRVGALTEPQGPWCLEIIAGMCGENETAEEVVRRELIEEANFTPQKLISICNYLSTPGGCDERVHLYCALGDLSNAEGIFGLETENEDIRLRTFSAQGVFDAMLKSRMNNAATLIALQWLQLNIDSLRQTGI